jgi:hypothetical protein
MADKKELEAQVERLQKKIENNREQTEQLERDLKASHSLTEQLQKSLALVS